MINQQNMGRYLPSLVTVLEANGLPACMGMFHEFPTEPVKYVTLCRKGAFTLLRIYRVVSYLATQCHIILLITSTYSLHGLIEHIMLELYLVMLRKDEKRK